MRPGVLAVRPHVCWAGFRREQSLKALRKEKADAVEAVARKAKELEALQQQVCTVRLFVGGGVAFLPLPPTHTRTLWRQPSVQARALQGLLVPLCGPAVRMHFAVALCYTVLWPSLATQLFETVLRRFVHPPSTPTPTPALEPPLLRVFAYEMHCAIPPTHNHHPRTQLAPHAALLALHGVYLPSKKAASGGAAGTEGPHPAPPAPVEAVRSRDWSQ